MAHAGPYGYPYLFRRDLSFCNNFRLKLGKFYYTVKSSFSANFSLATWPTNWYSEEAIVDESIGLVTWDWLPPLGAIHSPILHFEYQITKLEVPTTFRAKIGLNNVYGVQRERTYLRDQLSPMGLASIPTPSYTDPMGRQVFWQDGVCDAVRWVDL